MYMVYTFADEKPMQCDLCGKQFKHLDHLNRHHREVHQNRYRYRCDRCGHGMAKLAYLKVHKCGRVRRLQQISDAPSMVDNDTEKYNLVEDATPSTIPDMTSDATVYSATLFVNTVTREVQLDGPLVHVADHFVGNELNDYCTNQFTPTELLEPTERCEEIENNNLLVNAINSNEHIISFRDSLISSS